MGAGRIDDSGCWCTGIVGILWFGLNNAAAIIAIALTALPAVTLNIWQGVKAIDMSLVHMAKAFRFRR